MASGEPLVIVSTPAAPAGRRAGASVRAAAAVGRRCRAMSRIIMDGNGRWAHAHGLPRGEGHRRGVEALRRAVRFAGAARHPLPDPVQLLVGELVAPGRRDRGPVQPPAHLHPQRPRRAEPQRRARPRHRRARRAAGRHPRPDRGGRGRDRRAIAACSSSSPSTTARATRSCAPRARSPSASRAARSAPEAIDHATFEQALDTVGIPDPDLIIRTSGEQRISNFLLWQAAYAELIFLPVLWPDFGDERVRGGARANSPSRERRYGGVVGV